MHVYVLRAPCYTCGERISNNYNHKKRYVIRNNIITIMHVCVRRAAATHVAEEALVIRYTYACQHNIYIYIEA
jgi:hypothetical protein